MKQKKMPIKIKPIPGGHRLNKSNSEGSKAFANKHKRINKTIIKTVYPWSLFLISSLGFLSKYIPNLNPMR